MKCVILAAGKGTRMREVSLGLPKILLPLGDKTIGDNLIKGFKDAGVSQVLIIVGHMEKRVRRHFGDGSSLGVSIDYVRQSKPLGTGHAASIAREFVAEDPFFVLAYGDIATPSENLGDLVADFRQKGPEASMSIYRARDLSKGAAVYVEKGYMRGLIEKPPKGTSTTSFDNAGIYVFRPKVFEILDGIGLSPRNEYELTDALTYMVRNGFAVRAYELGGFWSNVSSPEDLLRINKLVIEGLIADGKHAESGIVEEAGVSPLALVSSRATLRRCSVGPYTIVADGAKIMDGAKVQHAIICEDSVIREGAILDHVLVRPRTVVKAGTKCAGTRGKVLILPDEICMSTA